MARLYSRHRETLFARCYTIDEVLISSFNQAAGVSNLCCHTHTVHLSP